MNKIEIIVLSLVVIVALVALYFTLGAKSGMAVMYGPSDGCCFTVTLLDGTSYEQCSLEYGHAVTSYQLFQVEAYKGKIRSVSNIRPGPICKL